MGDPEWLSFPDPGGSVWGGRWQADQHQRV